MLVRNTFNCNENNKVALLTIPVAFHIIRKNDGSGDVTDTQINSQLSVLNTSFLSTHFRFSLQSIERINNTAWANHIDGTQDESDMKSALAVDPKHVLNFYTSDLPIYDIWGYADETENLILCPASEIYLFSEKKLIRINKDYSVIELNRPFQNRRVHSVWFKKKSNIFICGAGVFVKNRLGDFKEFAELPLIFSRRIRGNDVNDIMVAGDFAFLAHYNGVTWKELTEFNEIDLFYSLDFRDAIAVATG